MQLENRNANLFSDQDKLAKLFSILVDSVTDYAIFILDTNGIVRTWNAGARRFKGYEAHEIIGKHFSVFYTAPEKDIRKPWFELEVAAEKGRFEDEGWRVRKDGTKFWANVIITAIRDADGVLLGFGKVTRDLTERREAELRYRLLVEGVSDYAIYSLDPQGNITSWNTGAERIKGYTTQEILGQHFSKFYQPKDREAGMPASVLRSALENGHYEGEGWRVRKDGTRFWSSVVVTPIYDEENNLRGFSKVTRDISDRKRLLEEVQRHAADLESEVKQHEKTNAELEAFSYSVSHDLRAPLRAIEGFSTALREDFGDKLPNEAFEYLEEIRQASLRMSRLVQDLLDYSRLSRTEIGLTSVNIAAAIKSAIHNLGTSKDKIAIDVDPKLNVMAHESTLVQIFANLVTNALKFHKPDKQSEVRIVSERLPGTARISVQDNGIGIDPAYQDRVFKVFERLHDAEEYPGTGIGLAIVQRGIERMHGTVTLTSSPGKGSTFAITLPLAAEKESA